MRQDAVQKPQDRTRLGQAGGKVKGGSVVREQGSGFSGEKTGGRRQETGSGDRWAWRHRRGLAGWLWRGFAHSERVCAGIRRAAGVAAGGTVRSTASNYPPSPPPGAGLI